MPIYMSYDGVPGDVTAQGHSKWIDINSFQWGVGRGISTPTGSSENREASAPSVSEIVVTKPLDSATIGLLTEAYIGEGKTVKIDFCTTQKDEMKTYLTFELTNTMISGHSFSSGGDRPSESISLNFTKIMTKVITQGEAGANDKTPSITYNLGLAKTV